MTYHPIARVLFTTSDGMIVSLKRVIAWQIEQEMKAQHITKTDMAKKMRTSRAALNRLLDANDASLTLTGMANSHPR